MLDEIVRLLYDEKMRLTTKGRFAVTAMVDLALHGAGGAPVLLRDIGERQGISLAYLEQIFMRLRRDGVVASLRGPGGGYVIRRPLSALSVAEIIDAVGEGRDVTRCGGLENCDESERCLTHYLWSGLSERIDSYLAGITLQHLADDARVRAVARRQRFAARARGEERQKIVRFAS
jgi:Rrf2 family iron-sulfur cluster assembly transcriptional regulator